MSRRVLVAGVGNIFFGDDGFGVEVVRRLGAEGLPEGVKAVDFGIRGVHLAYELLEDYDAVILVDATPRGGPPGTLYLIEPSADGPDAPGLIDAHGLDPASVLNLVGQLGGTRARVVVVGCEPATLEEGIGLSPPVAAAVPEAVRVIRRLLGDLESGKILEQGR
jgi:hydrogenase maturation protease